MIQACVDLKQEFVNDEYFYWPAVSHICKVISLLEIGTLTILKSTPIVVEQSATNLDQIIRCNKELLPTACSPTRITLQGFVFGLFSIIQYIKNVSFIFQRYYNKLQIYLSNILLLKIQIAKQVYYINQQFGAKTTTSSMSDYFNSISAHIQGDISIDSKYISSPDLSGNYIISIGSDDIISWRDINTDQQKSIQLPSDHGYSKIALSPNSPNFMLGGLSKKVMQVSMINTNSYNQQNNETIYEALGSILDIKYSNSGILLSVATEQQKCIIIDLSTQKINKCRPGHSNKVINTFFSPDDQYVATIGADNMVLIYQLNTQGKDPQQVFRTKLPTDLSSLAVSISGCFHKNPTKKKLYVPGLLQLLECSYFNQHWQMKKINIAHSSPIICCQMLVNNDIMVTSCCRDLCLWSVQTMQRLLVFQQFPLTQLKSLNTGVFIGARNDGNIYTYNRNLQSLTNTDNNNNKGSNINNTANNMMDIQQNSRIQFQNNNNNNQDYGYNNNQNDLDNQDNQSSAEQPQMHIKYISSKKSKADKVIQKVPQQSITRGTSQFDGNRFAYVNLYGCVTQNREDNEQVLTMMQLHDHTDVDKINPKIMFRNKPYIHFSMYNQILCYASQNVFGIKIDKFTEWQKQWPDIQGVAIGGNWMAVANQQQIRILDLSGNHIKSISFNRLIVSLDAYENLLVVVYHSGIPMNKRQLLSMQIFSVNQSNALTITQSHVPITQNSMLRWFGFSEQGMLFSQDTQGYLRAYSLYSNQWTSIYMTNTVKSLKNIWIVGIKQYKIYYWKTTDEQPQPLVRPRLNLKQSQIGITTIQQYNQQMSNYPVYLFERYILDHQLVRWQLWGHHKNNRSNRNPNYTLSSSIINQKQIHKKHGDLDRKLAIIVIYLLKIQLSERALYFAKNNIRSQQIGRYLVQQFDKASTREKTIQLQIFYDEKRKQEQYENLMALQLTKLKKQAQNSIQTSKNNPMNPKNKLHANNNKNIQFSFSQSQSIQSQENSIMEDITYREQAKGQKQQQEVDNPFLKKKSSVINDNMRKKQIEDQVEKFGIKKKVDRKRL